MKTSINKRLLGIFAALTGIFIILIAASVYIVNNLYQALRYSEQVSVRLNLASELQLQVNKLLVPVNDYLLTGDAASRDSFDEIMNELSRLFTEIKKFEGDESWRGAEAKVEKSAVAYGEKGLEILYIPNPVGNKKVSGVVRGLNLSGEALIKDVEEFHRLASSEMQRHRDKAARLSRWITAFVMGISAVIIISILPLYYYLRKTVSLPLMRLSEGVKIIASGHLQHRLDIITGDELETVAGEFNRMSASLEEAKKELDKKIIELYTLYNISKVLSASFEVEELLGKMVHDIGRGLSIDSVMVMLVDQGANELYAASATDYSAADIGKLRFKLGVGLYGAVAAEGKPRLITNIAAEPAVQDRDIIAPDINSAIIVPFKSRGSLLGVLAAFRVKPNVFGQADMDLLVSVSEHVAVALENARLYDEIKLLAITDGLTGLYNHRHFRERLKDEFTRASRYSRPLSVVMIDIDSFKRYNDANGHPMGDMLLRTLADILKSGIRNSDMVARYGGEEFVVILSETHEDSAVKTAERLRLSVESHKFLKGETQPGGRVTVSLGVASLGKDKGGPDELVKRADLALYKAKNTGKNRVVNYADIPVAGS